MNRLFNTALSLSAITLLAACTSTTADDQPILVDKYKTVELAADLSSLTADEREIVSLMIEAADITDEIFWLQAYGDSNSLRRQVRDEDLWQFARINYGPWDRLDGNRPFVEGVGEKPPGANFYPEDMAREAFEEAIANDPAKADSFRSHYTVIRRDSAGNLEATPYHVAYEQQVSRVAEILRRAAELAPSSDLRRYLELRADAILHDDYRESDMAWLEMRDNNVEVVIGPIETYEDQLFGYKAAYETFVLIKDREWSQRLERYAAFLPALQQGLPVPDEYKPDLEGSDSDLNAYDALYYAGDANAGAKTIAINLPNDEEVQREKGTRRLQLKNSMQAKFDHILVPMTGLLIAEDQRPHVNFDAFFSNVMFHEVAHGLGIKETVSSGQTVREALMDQAAWLEEAKADVLGLYMISQLHQQGELETDLMDHYVTFVGGIFRSIRFGTASAHGRANIAQFNFLKDRGAISRNDDGRYRVHYTEMEGALNDLAAEILQLQGDGDYDGTMAFRQDYGNISFSLRDDLERVAIAGIPVDIVFRQGREVLQQLTGP